MTRTYSLPSILSLWLLGLLAHPANAGQDQVALLLRDDTSAVLQGPLEQYVRDVEERFPVKVHVVKGTWETPKEVREAIRSLHAEKAITGVILVGAMPMHHFLMHEHRNPNPLYYEDFDLVFVDSDKDGVDDAYKGTPRLKVWVANIRACEKAREDDIPGLCRFFAKTHDYYTGKAVPEPRTLFFSSEPITADWAGAGEWFKRRGGARFSAPGRRDDARGEGMHARSRDRSLQETQLHAHVRRASLG